MAGFITMRYNEKHGHWPFLKPKKTTAAPEIESQPVSGTASQDDVSKASSHDKAEGYHDETRTTVREL
jgi:hypothetical protein